MGVFVVSYSWYEDYSPTFVVGPDMSADEFDALCAGLVPAAANRALLANLDGFIGWGDIKTALLEELAEHGFKSLRPPEFNMWGSNIIRGDHDQEPYHLLGEMFPDVIARNEAVNNSLDEHIERAMKP